MDDQRKLVELIFPESGVSAVAEMLEEYAPRTCAAIWECLRVPARSYAYQSSWAGSEVAFELPRENQLVDPRRVPSFPTGSGENLTWLPGAGSLTWTYYPAYYRHGLPNEAWEFAITYATSYQPGSMLLGRTGFIPRNLFAVIVQNLEPFSVVCERARSEGRKEIVVHRYGTA